MRAAGRAHARADPHPAAENDGAAVRSWQPESAAVVPGDEGQSDRAHEIARRFGLQLRGPGDPLPRFVLLLTDQGLELRDNDNTIGAGLRVDFTGASARLRARRASSVNEGLARAIGLRKSARPTLVDATAGIGRDAHLLATLGCRVTMCERSRTVAALLDDALIRASRDRDYLTRVGDRLRLHAGDAIDALEFRSLDQRPQVIYIDPMYPRRRRSAQVKKDMQYLRALVGEDGDSSALLDAALKSATRRVVVKRRRTDPRLAGPDPTHSVLSGQVRFDVYLRTPPG